MDIKDIKAIIELMKRNDLTHFEWEREGDKIVLKKNIDSDALAAILGNYRAASPAPSPAAVAPPPSPLPVAEAEAPAAAPIDEGLTIKSPMVGTFYRSSGPGQEMFVKVGDYVDAETTVCIIEAMKVMNEIKAEVSGRIVRIAADDATPVAYGQVLFEIKA